MRSLVLLLAVMMADCSGLTGTGSQSDLSTPEKAQQVAFATKSLYVGVLEAAAVYNELPRCTEPPTTKVCSTEKMVTILRQGAQAAKPAVDFAETASRDLTNQLPAMQAAVQGAQKQVSALKLLVDNLPKK